MNLPEQRILDFIGEHHILTLAIAGANGPWCATCFYAYDAAANRFILTSDDDTRHIADWIVAGSGSVAGTIALETKMVGKIRGIQFSGSMQRLEGETARKAKKLYVKTFPIAALAPLTLWELKPGFIKMTDNRLGFGKKLIWQGERD